MKETELFQDVAVAFQTSLNECDCTVPSLLLPFTGVGWICYLTAQSPKTERKLTQLKE